MTTFPVTPPPDLWAEFAPQWAGFLPAGRRTAAAPLVPQATRLNWTTGQSDGAVQSATYRQYHTSPGGFTSCRLVYVSGSGVSGATPNDVTVRASVEKGPFTADYPGASTVCTRVTWAGATSKVLTPGQIAVSDPVAVTVAAAEQFATRTFVSVASPGMKWPASSVPTVCQFAAASNTGPWGYNPSADLTGGGATLSNVAATPFTPLAVLSAGAAGARVVGVVGDSICTGYIYDYNLYDPFGWPDEAFAAAGGRAYGCVRFALQSMTANGWAASATGTQSLAAITALGVTDVIAALGVNDVNSGPVSFAAMQTRLQAVWAACRAAGAARVYQATLTPVTTSTDNWATTGNQTPSAPGEAARVQTNDWVRTTPSGIDGYFDVADAVESARNSGKWAVNGDPFWATVDGIHPRGPVQHKAMAAKVGSPF